MPVKWTRPKKASSFELPASIGKQTKKPKAESKKPKAKGKKEAK